MPLNGIRRAIPPIRHHLLLTGRGNKLPILPGIMQPPGPILLHNLHSRMVDIITFRLLNHLLEKIGLLNPNIPSVFQKPGLLAEAAHPLQPVGFFVGFDDVGGGEQLVQRSMLHIYTNLNAGINLKRAGYGSALLVSC
jgi:hypothetical protein